MEVEHEKCVHQFAEDMITLFKNNTPPPSKRHDDTFYSLHSCRKSNYGGCR